MKNKKKVPSDYPQMIFRISETDKERLKELIETVTLAANRSKPDDWGKFRKNDVIVDALYLGLLTLEKRYKAKNRDV